MRGYVIHVLLGLADQDCDDSLEVMTGLFIPCGREMFIPICDTPVVALLILK
jgi:hypothetical protein